MRVKCILCDKVDSLNDEDPVAKRLRNRPIHTFMCKQCTDRIAERTLERQATGNFRLYRDKTVDDEW
ncbi:Uncharacterized protein YlaI [Bacillus sp. 491mf]|uniref:YlaI family protein n=1 Tax=Bacillus TaxID=1386 RepID=UPI0005539997|nr:MULTISPECIES: YlaI family protein [unclassified Bacillus (in: firmicutes)]SFB93196.1 Uncharacterized protein YlaI [Bacillus sp. 491mf]